jgi:hypothetical protein
MDIEVKKHSRIRLKWMDSNSGNLETCERYAIGKALDKNVNKKWLGSSNMSDECLYINISSIKERIFWGTKFWALIVDDCTDYF